MKNIKYTFLIYAGFAGLIILLIIGCSRDVDELVLASYPTTPEVFIDGFSAGLQYDAFGDSKVTAFEVDTREKYKGSASMRFDVPNSDDPAGGYAAGLFRVDSGRDLSGYNVLTFWAKASQSVTIEQLGLGFTFDEEVYKAHNVNVTLSTAWTKYYIPIPDASKLNAEKGMFYYVATPQDGKGYSFWVDEVKYENLSTIAYLQPKMFNGEDIVESAANNSTILVTGLNASFNLPNGINQTVNAAPAYFNFTSSNENVAAVNESGIVSVFSEGSSKITASLSGIDAQGSLTVNSTGDFVHAPTPTRDAADVISLFSNAYTNVPVDYYNGFWAPFQTTESADFTIQGDDVLNYINFNFVGIQFTGPTIDATEMTHLHLDIWIPNPINPVDQLNVKIVDLGPDGSFDEPNSETGMTISSPGPLVSQSWISLDISLAGLTSQSKLAQIIFSNLDSPLSGFYADNIYFYKDDSGGGGSGATEPTEPAPDPTHDASDVISVFSDAYTNIAIGNLNPGWGQSGTVIEESIGGNNTLKYENFNFQGTEFAMPEDVSGMEFVHIDMWTADATDVQFTPISQSSGEFLVGLTPITSGQWTSYDIPLSDFMGVSFNDIFQLKFDGQGGVSPSNIWLDNIYFYKDGGGSGATEPTEPAPDPTHDASDVISVFSDAYTNIAIGNLNPGWGQSGTVIEESIGGNNTLKYENFNFQGTEFAMPEDVSGMEFVHIDMWTADATDVQFTPISQSSGEFLVGLTPITSGQWTSYDIPLSDFMGVSFNDIFQLKFDGQGGVSPSNIWLDNIYFYKDGGGSGATEPTEPAPDPTHDASDVISVFSDAYTNIAIGNLNPGWGQSGTVIEESIGGNNTLKYENFNFQGTEFAMPEDVSGMEFVHIDMWTADATDVQFTPISQSSGEFLVGLTPITSGQWTSYDIPLSDFMGVSFNDIFQLKFDGQGGVSPSNIWLDNIYFYKDGGGSGATEPTEPAPDPTHDASNVISVFSDTYTNIAIGNLNPGWGQSGTVIEESIGGNNTLKYENFNFQGTEFAMPEDVSGMEFVHIDMWTADATDVQFTPISQSSGEFLVGLTPITSGQWTSYDIPLSDFMGVSFNDIFQLKFDGQGGVSPSNIWLDNIYFYKDGGGGMINEPSLPLTFEDGILPFIAFDNGATAAIIDNPDMTGNASAKVLEFKKVVGSAWYSGIVFDDNLRTTPLFDIANGTIVTFKIWSPKEGVTIRCQLEGGTAPAYEVFQTVDTANEWITMTFDFTSQVNVADSYPKISIFPDFDTSNQNPVAAEAIYYIDDITQQ